MNMYEKFNNIKFPIPEEDIYRLGRKEEFTLFNIENISDYACNTYSKNKPFKIDKNLPVSLELPYSKTCFMFNRTFVFTQITKKEDIFQRFLEQQPNELPERALELIIYEDYNETNSSNIAKCYGKNTPVPSGYVRINIDNNSRYHSLSCGINFNCIMTALKYNKENMTNQKILEVNNIYKSSMGGLFEEFERIAGIVLLTLTFMNCKNINVDSYKERIVKTTNLHKTKRKTSPYKTIEYKVLSITVPGKKGQNNDQSSSSNRGGTRLHSVSGHPAFYTKEKPLFGKYVGIIWVPAHMRGSSVLGEIKKSYTVNIDS